MTVEVNGKAREITPGTRLHNLLHEVMDDPGRPGIAVAVNGEVVRRDSWREVELRDGDRIEVVKATQGG